MAGGIDPAEVKRRLSCAGVAQHYGVKLLRSGRRYLALCPFHVEKTPSFGVDVRKEVFHCFGCGVGGDVIELVRLFDRAANFPSALQRAIELAGLVEGRAIASGAPKPRVIDPARIAREDQVNRETARRMAYDIWRSCRPVEGTLVETYLRTCRAIPLDELGALPVSIRFHEALRHADINAHLPVMVAAVQGADDRFAGIHRTYLRLDGGAKAAVSSPKKMLGSCYRGAVRLGPATETLLLAEGIETGLSLAAVMAAGRRHRPGRAAISTWCALSLGNLAGAGLPSGASPHPDRPGMMLPSVVPDPERPGVILPAIVRRVVICRDRDEKDQAAAGLTIDRAVRRYRAQGREALVMSPPDGLDFNDWLIAALAGELAA